MCGWCRADWSPKRSPSLHGIRAMQQSCSKCTLEAWHGLQLHRHQAFPCDKLCFDVDGQRCGLRAEQGDGAGFLTSFFGSKRTASRAKSAQ